MADVGNRTLLQMVNAAQGELGLPQTSAVIAATDNTTIQMLALANRAVDDIRRYNRWTCQQAEFDIVVQVPINTTGNVTTNSPVITNIPSTAGIVPGAFAANGTAISQAARVLSVDSPSQVTLNMEATGTAANTAVSFARDTYPMPTDIDWMNNRTFWDRTNRWELLGPDSPQMDQWHRSGIVVTGPRRHFRQIGPAAAQYRLWPPPFEIATPLQIAFEYLSINAVIAHGTGAANPPYTQLFQNDDDTTTIDSQAVITGIKWMFWEAKGFNFVPMQNRWIDYLDMLAARDGAAPTLNLVKRVHPIFISPANVQDGFFPGPVGPNNG